MCQSAAPLSSVGISSIIILFDVANNAGKKRVDNL